MCDRGGVRSVCDGGGCANLAWLLSSQRGVPCWLQSQSIFRDSFSSGTTIQSFSSGTTVGLKEKEEEEQDEEVQKPGDLLNEEEEEEGLEG